MKIISHPTGKRIPAVRNYALLFGLIFVICTSVFGEEPPIEEWVARYGPGYGSDQAYDLAVDSSGNVYVTGWSAGSGTGYDYATIKYNTDGNELWVARYNTPGNDDDKAQALALDNSGNVYVTGYSYGSGTHKDYATVKYSPDGNQLWVARYDGPGNGSDQAYDLVVDNPGNIYVTGSSGGSGTDYATVKYSPDGNELWVARYNSDANLNDEAQALALDNSGNVYVTGQSGSGAYSNYATVKYSPDGNELWAALYNGDANNLDAANALAVDNSGNVYVTGMCDYLGMEGGDYGTIKYSPDGNKLWASCYNGPGDNYDEAFALAVDNSGNVYVTGRSDGGSTGIDCATIKYSSDGNELWVARYNGPENGDDSAYALAIDNSGDIYVTGYGTHGGGTYWDYTTIKYSPDGNQLWVARYNGPGNSADYANALAVDNSGNVYVTGDSYGSGTDVDYATIKYTQPHYFCIYVDANATGAGDGSSWADAYNYLQDALADPNLIGPAEIWVAEGIYKPDLVDPNDPNDFLDRSATFQLINGVAIYGGFPSGGDPNWNDRDPNIYQTILSGDLAGNDIYVNDPCDLFTEPTRAENSYHVVTGSYTNSNTILDGFTITAGNANAPPEVPFPGRHGGGMFNIGASCKVNNCIFIENSARYGGGIDGSVDSNYMRITNCTFLRNDANDNGGGIDLYRSDNVVVANCTFIANVGTRNGPGGMSIVGCSYLTMTNCVFSVNSGPGGGGLTNLNGSSPTITNCTFRSNSTTGTGGGINDYNDCNPIVTNCIFWNNSAPTGPQIYDGYNSSATVNYCDVQGGWAGIGSNNIDDNPLFVDANGPDDIIGTEDDNLRLSFGSPCIDAGDNNSVPADTMDLDNDANITEPIPFDLDGEARFEDDLLKADTGNGTAPIVDMGAYERWFNIPDPNLKAAVEAELGLTDPNAIDMLALTELNADNNGIVDLTGLEYATNLTVLYLNDNQITDISALTGLTNLTVLDLTGNPLDKETRGTYLSLILANNPGIELSYDTLTIYVDVGAVGNNDGTTWADAFNYLQDALEPNLVIYGDQIWVAQGTYQPDEDSGNPSGTGDREATFQLINGVAIYGGFPSGGGTWDDRDAALYETILSGDINVPDVNTDNSYHVVTGSGTDVNAILDGFTITAGKADGSSSYDDGGGMYNFDGDPTINNCIFSDNSAYFRGGGMYNDTNSNPTLTNCTFIGNMVEQPEHAFGGGMSNNYSSPNLIDCTFSDNLAMSHGGGMCNIQSSPTVANCTFSENSVYAYGGGIYNQGGTPTVTNCAFVGNLAGNDGGGMSNRGESVPMVANCTFSGNESYKGGGMYNGSSIPTVTNCTFSGNSADTYGGGIYNYDSNSNITNCILWGNADSGGTDESAQIRNAGSSTPVVNYCCVEGWTGGLGGTGNIGDNPLLRDTQGRLQKGSPCIDAGDNTAVPGGIVTDLDGRPRFADDPYTTDTGNGTPPIVDMGAYEYQPPIHVDANASGANNGTTWADAYNYLQDALADPNLIAPAEIWVAQGTYRPDESSSEPNGTGDRNATFQLINGVAIYGGFPSGGGTWNNHDPKIYQTILSGDLAGNDIYVNDPCDLFTEPTRAENSYHVVTGSYTDANAILDGFTITGGNANASPEVPFPGRHGGGMFNLTANCKVNNCTFIENSARYGGGMAGNTHSDYLRVTNCAFLRNDANENGGGMDLYLSDNVVVANCTFIENVSVKYGSAGMSIVKSSSPTVTNCTFSGNLTYNWGGGGLSNVDGSSPTITNCTFTGNSVTDAEGTGGGIIDSNDSNPIITNCIFWNNSATTDPQISDYWNSSATVNYCDVQGGWAGTGSNNIDANPLIWDTKVRGRLLKDSPCRNAGDPNGDYSGQTDIDGQPRVLEGRVDIGADELPPPIQNIDTGETYDTIQDAIDDANNGETIVVQYGTYTGPGNAGIDFKGKAITLRSAEPNEPYAVAATIIDCNNNYETGVYFRNGEGPDSVLNGFTIANASAEDTGGGIYCKGSSPTIKNCILRNNTAGGGCGIHCSDSANPTIDGGTIRNNSPDGVYIDSDSSVRILGVVHIISNDIVGAGTLQMGAGGSLDLDKAKVFTNMSGPGTVTVALGAEATIDGNCVINLRDPCDPNVQGTIDSKGFLKVVENAKITNAKINVTRAAFEDKAEVKKCEIHVDSKAPYGTSVFADPNTNFIDVNIYADGDRYMDLEPNVFDGNFVNVKIFVTITEGVGQLQGGLLECRGDVVFADVNSCDPNNIFFCLSNAGTIPDCNTRTWTLERLELIPGAKLNLTNRFPFQPPYDPGTDYDVVYVKELILRQGSVLNTSFNHIYYGSLIKEPNAVIRNEPLLGFSMINIAMDDQTEFIVRVTHNNYTDPNDPNYSRAHVERLEGLAPDANGMMIMQNFKDINPNSPDYNDIMNARAKGLFSKSNEGEIFIRFEYLFGAIDPNTELVIYLSDIPELGDVNDPNDYFEVARLLPPLPNQPGSVGSGRFGVFKQYVPTGGLNFVRGTRVEFVLLGGNGVYMYINNWDPLVLCTGICLDINFSGSADEEDFLTVLGSYGISTESPDYACLEGPFGENGTVDSVDICGWDWALNAQALNCCGMPLTGGGAGAGGSSSVAWDNFGHGYQLDGFRGTFDDILVCGKKGTNQGSAKMEDALYVFDGNGQYLNKLTPDSNRANIRVVEDFDGNVYQINSETGIRNLDSNEVIVVWPASLSGINEPRYGTSANVYIGIQGTGDDLYGRPTLDAAFDPDFADNNCVYIVPVVVEPSGKEAYVAAAKLQLLASSYSVVKLYDDPDAANPGDNRELETLREVEVDTAGNLYVLNACSDNESDILWRYNASSGEMIERLVLGDSSSADYVPSPSAMYLSIAQDMLYLASSLNEPNANSSTIYGFSTSGILTLARKITVNGMGHVTGITEDPTTGTLWAVGFSMEPPEYPDADALPFYDPNLAEVPIGINNVNAICTLSGDPNNDLALPLSIVWTGAISLQEVCGGADLDSSGDVDLKDFSAFAQYWLETGCVVPDWCGGADLDPYIRNRGQVDLIDLAIFVQNWLESGCLE